MQSCGPPGIEFETNGLDPLSSLSKGQAMIDDSQ